MRSNLIREDAAAWFLVALQREKGQLLFPIRQWDLQPDNV